MAEELKWEERMHSVMAFNLQNTNKQKESNLKPVISLQSDGTTTKCATKSESLSQKIRGSLCSLYDQLLTALQSRRFNVELELELRLTY